MSNFGQVRTRRDGRRLTIEIELPESGVLSRAGRAENLVDPCSWFKVDDGRDPLDIKLVVCRRLPRFHR